MEQLTAWIAILLPACWKEGSRTEATAGEFCCLAVNALFEESRELLNRPFSLGGHVESLENKKVCFCTVGLAQTRIQREANRAKTKLFVLLRLNMAAE